MYRVFLVDDEPWNIKGLMKLISWEKYGFIICGHEENGEAAWEHITQIKPDVILSDIRMPLLNGLELLAKIRQADLDIEVVFFSGFADFKYAQEALRLDSFDYLLKPVEEEALIDCMNRLKEQLDAKNATDEDPCFLSNNVIVRQTIDYLDKNYGKKIKNSDLAEMFQLSNNYYASLIKKHSGKTISELLLAIRIQKAENLLKTTNLSIGEIGEKIGYADYFYFTKLFKKATGISPSEYRHKL